MGIAIALVERGAFASEGRSAAQRWNISGMDHPKWIIRSGSSEVDHPKWIRRNRIHFMP
jgi:hypothetical protein